MSDLPQSPTIDSINRANSNSVMVILMPCHPFRKSKVDPSFEEEFAAAGALGFEVRLYHHESVVKGDVNAAIQSVDFAGEDVLGLLRGWMMSASAYRSLFEALRAKGLRLQVDPDSYAQAHYLPNAYPLLEPDTPFSAWVEGHDAEKVWAMYEAKFRDHDAIMKDYVKSAKHRWEEACFVPKDSSREQFDRVLQNLVNDRGNLFEQGIVLRRYIPLQTDGRDMRGYLRAKEFRLFYYHHKVLIPIRPAFAPPAEYMQKLDAIAKRFSSLFFSMDVAETAEGSHIIIEIGDGGVSGLPGSLLAEDFYEAIAERSREKTA